jgi:hypothetical protein
LAAVERMDDAEMRALARAIGGRVIDQALALSLDRAAAASTLQARGA